MSHVNVLLASVANGPTPRAKTSHLTVRWDYKGLGEEYGWLWRSSIFFTETSIICAHHIPRDEHHESRAELIYTPQGTFRRTTQNKPSNNSLLTVVISSHSESVFEFKSNHSFLLLLSPVQVWSHVLRTSKLSLNTRCRTWVLISSFTTLAFNPINGQDT